LENAYRHLLNVMGIDERIPIHCAFNKDNPLCAESGEYLIRSSYNVILTTNYLMVVPRSVPNAGLNINAMGKFSNLPTYFITIASSNFAHRISRLTSFTCTHKERYIRVSMLLLPLMMHFSHVDSLFRNQGPYAVLQAVGKPS
jgi:hypothetical protein